MNAKITIDKQHSFDLDALAQMYRLRAKVFGERMGWEVAVLSGMEIDQYDAHSPYYMLVRDASGAVCGCWRLLPTQGPYMLRDTFPELLHGQRAPACARVWELSRFAIVSPERAGYGFGELALDAMRAVVDFADRMGVTSYVTVTTTAVERLLARARIEMRRFGPPMKVGRVSAVALAIDLGKQTHEALFGLAHLCGLPQQPQQRLEQLLRPADECAARLVKT
ncbi:MAG: GNAT family N-acetyltransferase [Burkholderiales bacterium]|nr:GNAT family N-acetyltransferase [Burkholderiales bacterium]